VKNDALRLRCSKLGERVYFKRHVVNLNFKKTDFENLIRSKIKNFSREKNNRRFGKRLENGACRG